MTTPDYIATLGVGLLLFAFAMNQLGRWSDRSRLFLGFNAVGAGIAAFAAWLMGSIPFVVLESTWGLVALLGLLRPRPQQG